MAPRGRKPLPTHLKLVEGNPGKRKLNRAAEPPAGGPPPEPPAHLIGDGLAEWKRLAPGLVSLGVLTAGDVGPFAAYCDAYATWKQAVETLKAMAEKDKVSSGLLIKTSNGNVVQNPIVGVRNKAAEAMVKYAAEFGLTPSARSRLAIETDPGKKGKFAGLLGGS